MDTERTRRARRRLVDTLRDRGFVSSVAVATAMDTVPRHAFVPGPVRELAYEDRPLEIGRGQVVTAPHLVARMTELLDPRAGQSVLEVGTGSGYHAAVLAELVGTENVVTVERFHDLARTARDALVRAGYGGVAVLVGDGTTALAREPCFDRINVTAVAPTIPAPLLDRLAAGGRLVIPLGPRDGPHELTLVTRDDGRVERTRHGRVRFVPLIGEHGFPDDE